MKAPASRRGLILGLAALPLTGGAATAAPPSDLARACEWAADHWLSFDARCRAENWDDDRLDAESDLFGDVLHRALAEPSRSTADLKAKARLCLVDFEAALFPMRNVEENGEPDDGERMVLTVLREVIELCA